MNRELLAKVRDRIAEVGDDHCDMSDYTVNGTMPGSGEPPCGTKACIAGHAFAVQFGSFGQHAVRRSELRVLGSGILSQKAARLLDLPDERLFYANCWPARHRHLAADEGDAKAMLAICDGLLDDTLDLGEFSPFPY